MRRAENLPISLVINAGAGSHDANARAVIEAHLAASGRDASILVAHHPREVSALAASAPAGIIAAAGGDGTVNAVAGVAHQRGLPFGVIPFGTFNYFARELGIPAEIAAAVAVLAHGHTRKIAIGRVNGHLFLNNASIGLYRRLIEEREAHKQRFGRSRLVAVLSGLVTALRQHPAYRLRLEVDGQAVTLSSLTVFFGRNALQMEQLGLDEAQCVARGELAVLALREVSRRQVLGLIFRAALGRLENAKNLRQHCALAVEVDRAGVRRSIRVAIDGELVECSLPLTVEAIPDALTVVVPEPAEGAGQ